MESTRKEKEERRNKMPGSTIKINNRDELEWYVGDSKIDDLIQWLNEMGEKLKTEPPPPPPPPPPKRVIREGVKIVEPTKWPEGTPNPNIVPPPYDVVEER